MHEREVTTIACRVEGRRRLRQVLADDTGVADLLVTERQFVVRKADRAGIMSQLGMLQRARMQRDRARLFTAGVRDAAVQTPECRELRVADWLAQRIWRSAERGRRLGEVIAQQPGFGQRGANGNLILSRQRAWAKQWCEQLPRLGSAPPFEGG